jgi:hypothetical protein
MNPDLEKPMTSDTPNPEPLQALWTHCRAFVEQQHISCSETVYQTDHVIENACEFIDGVCKIVGFAEVSS